RVVRFGEETTLRAATGPGGHFDQQQGDPDQHGRFSQLGAHARLTSAAILEASSITRTVFARGTGSNRIEVASAANGTDRCRVAPPSDEWRMSKAPIVVIGAGAAG